MQVVFVLITTAYQGDPEEKQYISGIYSTRELAEKAMKDLNRIMAEKNVADFYPVNIEERFLDATPIF